MALGYREHAAELESKNVIVYGINDGDIQSAQAWVESEDLPFSVLLDEGRSVGIDVGMSSAVGERYVQDPSDGRRPAVVLDQNGHILEWEPDMNDVAHIADLVARL